VSFDVAFKNDSLRPPLTMKLLLFADDGRVDGAALDGFLAEWVVLIADLELKVLSDKIILLSE